MQMSKKRIIYTAVVTLIVVFSSTYAILMTLERMDYRNYLQGEYSKNMYHLNTALRNVGVNLAKVPVAGTKDQSIILFEDIFRNSSIANMALHSLPVSQEISGNVSRFLAQVGDFSYTLVRASTEGRQLTNQEYESINSLKQRAYKLQSDLDKIEGDINQGRVKWGEIRKKVTGFLAKNNENLVTEQFVGLQKQIMQYPALIYDGPFSDNNLQIKPKINLQGEVSRSQALETVRRVLGNENITAVDDKGTSNAADIPTYGFDVAMSDHDNKDKVTCEVSRRGGRILYLLDNRIIGASTIDSKQAIDFGNQYLTRLGYKNMEPTYTMNYGDALLITYIYNQNGVAIYPDQIKLKIALDDGGIVGIESDKYLRAHEDTRTLPKAKITAEEGRKKVSPRLNITRTRLAVIPTETNTEVLCYEYAGTCNGDNFMVYINAITGYEQRILQIQNTPNGQLTM